MNSLKILCIFAFPVFIDKSMYCKMKNTVKRSVSKTF